MGSGKIRDSVLYFDNGNNKGFIKLTGGSANNCLLQIGKSTSGGNCDIDVDTRFTKDVIFDKDISVGKSLRVKAANVENLNVLNDAHFENNVDARNANITNLLTTKILRIPIGRPASPQTGDIWME